ADAHVGEGVTLGDDEALVGAAKISMYPQPDAEKGQVWEKNRAKCLTQSANDANNTLTHAADWSSPWIENTNCIYAGGFGLGPSQPLIEFDSVHGLWIRSVAYAKDGQTLVLTLIDAEGYFGQYNSMCGAVKCGIFDIQDELAAELAVSHPELGAKPESFIMASTHAHSAPDLIGGWGGVPKWYMDQIANALRDSVRQAIDAMEPAVLEAGESLARGFNSERRSNYHSAEDPTLNWLRASDRDGNTIATVGTYAAHPTSFGGSWAEANGDWPAQFAMRAEERFGGVAIGFNAGLGNMSARGNSRGSMGVGLADRLPALGAGTLVSNPRVRVKREFWDQPVTNLPLGSLGAAGFFDRPFGGPAVLQVPGKEGTNKPCRSSGPTSVRVTSVAAKIGDVVVTAAPGEIFANFSNTIEETSPITGLAIGQANDALGYMPQQFETDYAARQGLGFAGARFFEYEDAYSIDHCFGDKALEVQTRLLKTL
ncbi:MAG TPA: hypothetical protein VM600_06305, partial [Actinomycetota bacterium]|nr:hypothetical protein [Actinomycetota bacterium]